MRLRIKRIYEPFSEQDGIRVLVDRLWPRGISKEHAQIDHWFKEIAPSHELRTWYNHDPAKWEAFKCRYFAELSANPGIVDQFNQLINSTESVTLIFSSKELELNNAAALKLYLEQLDAA